MVEEESGVKPQPTKYCPDFIGRPAFADNEKPQRQRRLTTSLAAVGCRSFQCTVSSLPNASNCALMSLLAFIGGTGFDLRGADSPFSNARDEQVSTRFGVASLTRAVLSEREIVFLHRHARPDDPSVKDVPPHRINYRANIASLKILGVTGVLASTAVGSLRRDWRPGTLVCLDNFLDLTTNRARTFFDNHAVHIDASHPYCADLRRLLLEAAAREGVSMHDGGVYAGMDGPRFETAAEIRMLQTLGADVVGMTGTTEATLAREAEISYASVSIVTNLAAGLLPQPLTQEEVMVAMQAALPRLARVFLSAAREYRDYATRPSRTATREFVTESYDPMNEIMEASNYGG